METIYTRKAKHDLQGILDYYGERSPSALQNIVTDIIDVVDDIPLSISKGRKTPHPDVWEKVTPKYGYVLPYYIYQDRLFILRVYDTRRRPLDYSQILDLKE